MGNRLPISVDLVDVVGHVLFDHGVISRPPDERFSDVERHPELANV